MRAVAERRDDMPADPTERQVAEALRRVQALQRLVLVAGLLLVVVIVVVIVTLVLLSP